jgi:predicted aspartyl protease
MPNIVLIAIAQICLLYSGSCLAQVPGFYMKKESRKTEIPFINSNNLIILPVSINENEPVNFIVDTGVRTNIFFSKSVANLLGLKYTRSLNLVGADGKTVLTASVSPNNHLDLGNVEGRAQTILVLDEDFFELEQVIGIPIYGVLGYEFFKFNPIRIDYSKSKMFFYRTEGLKWRPFGFRKLGMPIEFNKPYINARVKQVSGEKLKTKLLIDTGANHGLLLNPETTDEIIVPPINLETNLGRSLGGDLYGVVGRAKSVGLKGLTFNHIIASFPFETEYSYVIKETGRQGSIGSELLGRLELIIDYPRERFLFKRAVTFTNPFEYDMSGITPKVLPREERIIYIAKLKEQSPAYNVGLRELDEIIEINKIPIAFWELSDIIKIFRSEPGKEISIRIKRPKDTDPNTVEEIVFRFFLRRQI